MLLRVNETEKAAEALQECDRFWYLQRIALPLFAEFALQTLVVSIDQYMISSYSHTAVAAIGNCDQLLTLILMTFNFLSAATVIMISQYKGAKETEKEHTVYTLSVFMNNAVGLILSLGLFFFNRPLFALMGVPEEVTAEAQIYMRIVGGTVFIQALFLGYSAFLRCNALMRFSLMISIVSNIVNVALNYLLIYGNMGFPELGVAGAAIATAASRLAGLVIIIVIFANNIKVKISLKRLHPFPFTQLKRLLQIGLPSVGESTSYNLTRLVILAFVNTFGTAVINTYMYAMTLTKFSSMYTRAMANAAQVVLGRFLGAKMVEKANEKCMSVLRVGITANFMLALIMYLFSDSLFGIFTDNPEILTLGKTVLLIDIFLGIGRALNVVLVYSLQTAGDILVPTGVAVVFGWVVSVGAGFVLSVVTGLGLAGIWAAMALDEMFRGIINFMRWKQGKWKQRDLVR